MEIYRIMNRVVAQTCCAVVLLLSSSVYVYADIAVIVSEKNATTQMSAREVRKLFLGKSRKLPDGSRALLVGLQPIQTAFNKSALRKADAQVKAAWSRLLFSGRAKPPREFSSASAVIEFVAGNSNAVGYVPAEELDDGVKAVFILR